MSRACIFCGGGPLTREHLLSDWLRDVLPSDDPAVHFVQLGKDESDRREFERRPFRERTRFVCKGCNTGWMSRSESAAQPVLEAPIQHQRCTFDPAEQTTAATWAFKTCLVFLATQLESAVAPPQHFLSIRRDRKPPPQTAVWIGSHYRAKADPINSIFLQRPLALEPVNNRLKENKRFGYLNFLAVGGVAFVVVAHGYRNRTEIEYEGALNDALDQIWPNPSGVILWPPRAMMDRAFVDVMTLSPGGFNIRVWPP